MKTLRETALAADQEFVAPMMQWRYNGQPAGNGWTSESNNAAFGTDYIHRMGAVKAYPYSNKRNETVYFYTANDTQGQPLVGKSSYTVTFPKGQLPPTKGFWSLTVYNPEHFFYPNALERFALGTKNKIAEVQRRRQPDHLSREPIAGQREGIQLATGAGWRFFDLDPRLLARPGHPRWHLEAAGDREGQLGRHGPLKIEGITSSPSCSGKHGSTSDSSSHRSRNSRRARSPAVFRSTMRYKVCRTPQKPLATNKSRCLAPRCYLILVRHRTDSPWRPGVPKAFGADLNLVGLTSFLCSAKPTQSIGLKSYRQIAASTAMSRSPP